MVTRERSPLTDSPWFWVLAFASMAMGALIAIGPKYGGRQARIERQYQARERILEDRLADDGTGSIGNNDDQAERTEGQGERREFASPEDTLIPLWPLAVVLSLLMIFSAVMLVRGRGRAGSQNVEGRT